MGFYDKNKQHLQIRPGINRMDIYAFSSESKQALIFKQNQAANTFVKRFLFGDLKMKAPSPGKTFCVRPFMHLATRTYGEALPCCVGGRFKTLQMNQHTFSEAWRSPEIKEIRRRMLSNQPVDLCKVCYMEEKSGIESHRTRSNKYWEKVISYQDILQSVDANGDWQGPLLSLDLRIGNTCNLACTMCGPNESTLWIRQMNKLQKALARFDITQPVQSLTAHLRSQSAARRSSLMQWHRREELQQDLKSRLPFLKEIVLGGGEPFLIPSQDKIIRECIKGGWSKNIELYYHTNATLIKKEFFEKFKAFKKVMLFISLDACGARNNYIRYPSSFERLEENIELVDKKSPRNVESMILCTVQIKNMYYLPEFCQWTAKKKFKKVQAYYEDLIYTGLVHHPPYLSIQVYPAAVKEKITKNVENLLKIYGSKARRFQSLVDFMNKKDESRLLPQFKRYVQALDKVRGARFKEVFPELARDLKMDH